jgi:hypothetical protein
LPGRAHGPIFATVRIHPETVDEPPFLYCRRGPRHAAGRGDEKFTTKWMGDPAAWTVVDGKLYLNYTLDVRKTWAEDIPDTFAKANCNWPES